MTRYDAAIVGAGPAGSALAAFLGRAGLKVLLADRARFPRAKVCGEYMSPQALLSLEHLGVLGTLEALHPRRLRGLAVHAGADGAFRADYEPVDGHVPFRPYGFGVSRLLLDDLLVRHAQGIPGVTFRDGFSVTRLLDEGGRVTGIAGRAGNGPEERLEASLVIGADGIRSRVARWAGLARPPALRKFAFMAHLAGLSDENRGELHLGPDCYAGIAPVEGGLANVNLVVDEARLREVNGDPARFFETTLNTIPGMAARLEAGRRTGPVRSVGPLAWDTRSAVADGVLLVGDAAGFVDPFTGEGLFMALRGAELAAEEIPRALGAGGPNPAGLAGYLVRRQAEFGRKLAVCRGIQRLLPRRRLAGWVIGRLGRRDRLARRLVAASGDYLPPERTLDLASLVDFLNPVAA